MTALIVAVAGGSFAAGAVSSDGPKPPACDDGATVHMYPEGRSGPLSLPDC